RDGSETPPRPWLECGTPARAPLRPRHTRIQTSSALPIRRFWQIWHKPVGLAKYILTFVPGLPYVIFDIRPEAEMGSTLKDVIRGDVPLARAIFNDERKRGL